MQQAAACFFLFSCIALANSRLHLSPYIQEGNTATARNLSLVWDPSGVIPKSYSGFITVDKMYGNHLFFWFFPADNPRAEILVWLNGGPTVSSMMGLFYENGPLRAEGTNADDVNYKRWTRSWTGAFSMLYIDNPVGTGFSYTQSIPAGYRTTQEGYGKDLCSFIEQFYILFPEHKNLGLYLGGQSYAGKYVTSFAYQLHRSIQNGTSAIPLRGIYLGGPYFDPPSQTLKAGDFFYNFGAISYKQMTKFKHEMRLFFEKNSTDKEEYERIVTTNIPDVLFQDNYVTWTRAPDQQLERLMNSYAMKKLVHTEGGIFRSYNQKHALIYFPDIFISAKVMMAELMDNYPVLIYNGDLDPISPTVKVDAGIMATPWSLQEEYNSSRRSPWNDGANGLGFYTATGRLCRVVVRKAGHFVPYDQPDISLDMMKLFVRHGCVSNKEDYRTYKKKHN